MRWLVAPQVVALSRIFDLDHVCAEIGETHCAVGAGNDTAEIYYPNAVERSVCRLVR